MTSRHARRGFLRQTLIAHCAVVLALLLPAPTAFAQAGAAATNDAPATSAAPLSTPGSAPSLSVPGETGPAPKAPTGEAPAVGSGTLPQNLSPWAMFLNADVVVKTVMVGLACASVVTWTVWIAKTLHLTGTRRRTVRGIRSLVRANSLSEMPAGAEEAGPVAALVHAARHEQERSAELPVEGIKERAAIALARIEARAARTMSRGTGIVATIGSTAPFVGLFGTVWGIMNSFVGISRAHTSNLAVVAPGIAEALLATAIGLVAAIPAVVIYNGFARGLSGYKALLSDAAAEVMRHLSRDLDRHLHGAG